MADSSPIERAALERAASLPLLSPSAPFDLRRIAHEKRQTLGYSAHWWDVYPEGHLAALAFRVWRLLGMEFWEIPGEELPE